MESLYYLKINYNSTNFISKEKINISINNKAFN